MQRKNVFAFALQRNFFLDILTSIEQFFLVSRATDLILCICFVIGGVGGLK